MKKPTAKPTAADLAVIADRLYVQIADVLATAARLPRMDRHHLNDAANSMVDAWRSVRQHQAEAEMVEAVERLNLPAD